MARIRPLVFAPRCPPTRPPDERRGARLHGMKTDLLRTQHPSRRAILSGLLVSTASVTRLGATAPPLELPPLRAGWRRLYLVRHGETDFNVKGRIQGRTNNPLNDNGLRQAALLSDYLSSQPLEVVASSTQQKAAVTADAVASRHPAAKRRRLKSFNEMCFGDFDGQLISAVAREYKEVARRRHEPRHAR